MSAALLPCCPGCSWGPSCRVQLPVRKIGDPGATTIPSPPAGVDGSRSLSERTLVLEPAGRPRPRFRGAAACTEMLHGRRTHAWQP